MAFSRRICAFLLLFLLCVQAFSLWALVSLGEWVVAHDGVWQQMEAEGALIEWHLAEAFAGLNSAPCISAGLLLACTTATVAVLSLVNPDESKKR